MAAAVPADLLSLIHFLDEDVGHWLLWLPYFPLLALLTYAAATIGRRPAVARPAAAVAAAAGALMGATHAVAVIESR
jgi:hypothetical protein